MLKDRLKPRNQPTGEKNFLQSLEIGFLMHELKTPLAVVETGLRSLIERPDKFGSLSPGQEKTLKRVLRNSDKLKELVYSLLEIGRSQHGVIKAVEFKPEQTLTKIIFDCLEGLGLEAEDRSAADLERAGVAFEVAPEAAGLVVRQDESKFRHIASNLILNALNHRTERIMIGLSSAGFEFQVEVRDDGPGIPEEARKTVFLPYRQNNAPATTASGGHGLGLAIADSLARSLGGKVEIKCSVEPGASFIVSLPREAK